MFIGRKREMNLLTSLFAKSSSSLVICRGRRRIGKSTLLREFGKKANVFLEFQGLAPRENIQNQSQLQSFSEQLAKQTNLPKLELHSWDQTFSLLASQVNRKRTVILLDEISWMAEKDRDFAGKLKIAWDIEFKKHRHLVLILCGSVSSWIETNILNSTGFVGRVSLTLTLEQLPLYWCDYFWQKNRTRIAAEEKLKLLSVTGGVPRYLEEIHSTESAEANIKRLCFEKEGLLFHEFDQIFQDIFTAKAKGYRDIITSLVTGSKTVSEISESMGKKRSGHLTEYLNNLVLSGFIKKDLVYKLGKSQPARLHKYRICDNYLRFYLKYIEPNRPTIEQGLYKDAYLDQIIQWETILGFQFENLVLNNIPLLCTLLKINPGVIQSASPYFQKKTKNQEACQIDLLIQTKYALYIGEIKCRRTINHEVISQVRGKIRKLPVTRSISIRTVLIYAGDLAASVVSEGYFDKIISFEELLQIPF